jgi:hypothetical protein
MPKEIIVETMSDEVKKQRIENLKNAREARAKKEELKNKRTVAVEEHPVTVHNQQNDRSYSKWFYAGILGATAILLASKPTVKKPPVTQENVVQEVQEVQAVQQPVYDTSFFESDNYGTSW